MDGWTLVQRGRGRQRTNTNPQRGDWGYGRSAGRKDRAPVPSFWRDNRVPFPNRRVPPPGSSRFPGPQNRSYAAVVKGPYQRQDAGWRPARPADPGVIRQAADPQLGRLIRKLHDVVKMVHHLQNVTPQPGKDEPKMISRMVDLLSGMIRPAAPTQATLDMISGNAKNWGYNTYLILMEHYEKSLENFLEEIQGILTPQWKVAFAVAVRWAKRKWPNITQDAIDQAEALIVARMDAGDPAGDPVNARAPQLTTARGQNKVPRPPAAQTSVATMTEREPAILAEESPILDAFPRPQRDRRRRSTPAPAYNPFRVEEVPPQEQDTVMETPERSRPGCTSLDALFDEEEERVEGQEKQRFPVVAQVHREEEEEDTEDAAFQDSFERFVDPGPQKFKVRRHINTQRKLTDWNLQPQKKFLIIGDSNLATIPDFLNKNVQVESFPGSHFRHAQALMEKLVPPQDLVVEKVVLSFGINSRANKCRETTVKNLQGALRSAKRKFPYAEVWIPLVNFSEGLPEEEKENLQTLNDHIERNMPYIDLLPDYEFSTGDDDVHWTTDTAQAMFNHWMRALNS